MVNSVTSNSMVVMIVMIDIGHLQLNMGSETRIFPEFYLSRGNDFSL
jgi:hypothetical protein